MNRNRHSLRKGTLKARPSRRRGHAAVLGILAIISVSFPAEVGAAETLASATCMSVADCDQECRNGKLEGCRSAGFIYEKGVGVQIDIEKAIQYYKLGCEGGPPPPGIPGHSFGGRIPLNRRLCNGDQRSEGWSCS